MGRRLKVKGKGNFVGIPDFCVFSHFLFKFKHTVDAAEISGRGKVHIAPDPVAGLNFVAAGPFYDFYD